MGPWSGVGVAAAQRLRKRGVRVVAAATAFGTYNHETRGSYAGFEPNGMSLARLQYEWELLWTRMTVDPSERRGYRGSDIVLVNYDSVREIIHRQFGSGISFGKMTYASEAAFLKAGSDYGEIPEMVARLEPKIGASSGGRFAPRSTKRGSMSLFVRWPLSTKRAFNFAHVCSVQVHFSTTTALSLKSSTSPVVSVSRDACQMLTDILSTLTCLPCLL